MSTRTINVDYLARVEGEGAMHIKIHDNQLEDVKLRIFEPPRFFEAFLRGRRFTEAPDITARICGICPVAYLLGAARAMEDVCQAEVTPQIRALRRLLYCGEWIESHILHMAMLHAPDFLGYEDSVQMAKDHPDVVQRALRLKKIGNALMTLIGGREIHPVNCCVGGFYKAPTQDELTGLLPDLRWALEAAEETVRLCATFPFEPLDMDYEFVCLSNPDEYAIVEGRLVSNKGIDAALCEYDNVLVEVHAQHSTALRTRVVGRDTCHVGPLARFNLNFDRLTPRARAIADAVDLTPPLRNPFRSILVRGVETVLACEEAIRLIETYEPPDPPHVQVQPRAGTGYGATEAPRGICYHRYTIDDEGVIQDAKIVSPTAVNQPTIEKDLRHYIEPNLSADDERLKWVCEQAIRNYDPCISCSAHFLNLTVERT